ncbi:sugar ABC transporter ATP-binding protein [Clostridium thermarum]|uniref:sugar ABC transporter ATP-binding protein n=1 Tax=Clostridium thermarum TaxID=1716543 RepID=UPI0013D63E05|nr:sugar ABC transporter ATP-binding protein [Clostridium thermarum]
MSNYLVELKNISKDFPGVKALDGVNFNLKAGEVHALLGENGAGKSTLMKILSGIYDRDHGEYYIDGNKIDYLTPKKAQELGIAIIHQELNMCTHLTVAENMFLGREDAKLDYIFQKRLDKKAKEMLSILNIDIDPRTVVGNLPISKQQMVEIAKALSANAKVIIMDEPTSALTEKEIAELFRIIKELKASGCGIIYISHRLEELEHIVDRVTILRDGKYVATKDFYSTSIPELISLMVGREIKEKYPRLSCKKGKKILEVQNLCSGKVVKNISFDLYEGEIIGISGLIGAGRTELLRAIYGADRADSGNIILFGEKLSIKSPLDAINAGIVCAPEDRKKEGLCIKLSVRENVSLANLDAVCNRFGVLNSKKEISLTDKVIKDLRIKTPSQLQEVKKLSGGNQQKLVVGKWLVRNAKVVIFDEPTRGIDVAAKVEIYNLMNSLKEQGIGVIFVSSELPEILGMSDRILVMCSGRITGDISVQDATQNKILHLATQYEKKEEVV